MKGVFRKNRKGGSKEKVTKIKTISFAQGGVNKVTGRGGIPGTPKSGIRGGEGGL